MRTITNFVRAPHESDAADVAGVQVDLLSATDHDPSGGAVLAKLTTTMRWASGRIAEQEPSASRRPAAARYRSARMTGPPSGLAWVRPQAATLTTAPLPDAGLGRSHQPG